MDVFLIFFFVFGFATWGIWKLYLVSRDTYGACAPDKVQRTYHTSKYAYFTHIDTIALVTLLQGFILFSWFIIKTNLDTPLKDIALFLILLVITLATGAYAIFYIAILLPNHWKFTKEVYITSLPEEKAVHISIRGDEFTIRNGDILDVHYISDKNSRFLFGYSVYTLKNNKQFILTDKVSGSWILDHFFKKIPYRHTNKPFPIIK